MIISITHSWRHVSKACTADLCVSIISATVLETHTKYSPRIMFEGSSSTFYFHVLSKSKLRRPVFKKKEHEWMSGKRYDKGEWGSCLRSVGFTGHKIAERYYVKSLLKSQSVCFEWVHQIARVCGLNCYSVCVLNMFCKDSSTWLIVTCLVLSI